MKTLSASVEIVVKTLTVVTNIAQEALSEAQGEHERIDNVIDRIKEMEHYLGLRHHHTEELPQEYMFRQVQNDVSEDIRPQSHYYKNNLKKRE